MQKSRRKDCFDSPGAFKPSWSVGIIWQHKSIRKWGETLLSAARGGIIEPGVRGTFVVSNRKGFWYKQMTFLVAQKRQGLTLRLAKQDMYPEGLSMHWLSRPCCSGLKRLHAPMHHQNSLDAPTRWIKLQINLPKPCKNKNLRLETSHWKEEKNWTEKHKQIVLLDKKCWTRFFPPRENQMEFLGETGGVPIGILSS